MANDLLERTPLTSSDGAEHGLPPVHGVGGFDGSGNAEDWDAWNDEVDSMLLGTTELEEFEERQDVAEHKLTPEAVGMAQAVEVKNISLIDPTTARLMGRPAVQSARRGHQQFPGQAFSPYFN